MIVRPFLEPTLRSRRSLLLAAAAGLLVPRWGVAATGEPPLVEVWKSPTCGCCWEWMQHMQVNGFRVKAHDVGNTAMRARLGIDVKLGSCHTALVDGYAIEGHVPAREVQRLLKERPKAIGLTVPGMPIGSPGMDTGGYAGRKEPYEVLLIGRDGRTSVFARYS